MTTATHQDSTVNPSIHYKIRSFVRSFVRSFAFHSRISFFRIKVELSTSNSTIARGSKFSQRAALNLCGWKERVANVGRGAWRTRCGRGTADAGTAVCA